MGHLHFEFSLMPWKVSGPKPQGFRVWGLGGEKLLRTTRGISEIQACAAPRNLQAGSIVLQAVECAVLERVLSGGFSALGPGLCGFGIASGLNCPRVANTAFKARPADLA